jgi:hypothetical protein
MPAPNTSSQWPSVGERHAKCTLQYATPVKDAMGGWGEPRWTDFDTWFAKVLTVPDISNEVDSIVLYLIEGPYVAALQSYFMGQVGLRILVKGMALKVFQVENPQLRNRTLIAHCAPAVSTQ